MSFVTCHLSPALFVIVCPILVKHVSPHIKVLCYADDLLLYIPLAPKEICALLPGVAGGGGGWPGAVNLKAHTHTHAQTEREREREQERERVGERGARERDRERERDLGGRGLYSSELVI